LQEKILNSCLVALPDICPGINSSFPPLGFIRLARSQKLRYADLVASGGSPPHPLSVAQLAIQIPVTKDGV
jgi:hypothetical protein